MNTAGSLLHELRAQYDALHEPTHDGEDVESYEAIDRRMRKAFRWLEQAIAYLNGLKAPVVRLMLGRNSAFLRRAPLAGVRR